MIKLSLKARNEAKYEASREIEAAFDKIPRNSCPHTSGHELVDTCHFYKFIQRYNRSLKVSFKPKP